MQHTSWAEVVPLVPLLIPISEICLCLFVLGLIACVAAFVRALFGTVGGVVGWIPYLNRVVQAPLHSIERKITGALGDAERAVDSRMGAALHQLARMVDWIGREFRAHANLLWMLSTMFLGTATTSLLHAGLSLLHLRIKSATHAANLAIHRILTLEKQLRHSIATTVYPRLGRLEREITHTIPREFKGIRARTKTIEGELSNLWDLLRKNEAALAATAFAGAVALALARMDLGWLRCRNTRNVGKALCGVNSSELDGLLGLLVGGAALLEFRELVKLAQAVEHGVAAGLQDVAKL
jgi:hypothetical protein